MQWHVHCKGFGYEDISILVYKYGHGLQLPIQADSSACLESLMSTPRTDYLASPVQLAAMEASSNMVRLIMYTISICKLGNAVYK